jgi:hypothetical protein
MRGPFAGSGVKRTVFRQFLQNTGSLLRFAHKTPKNRRLGDFYPANSERMLNNRVFYDFFIEKIIKPASATDS